MSQLFPKWQDIDILYPVHRFPEILISSRKISRQDPGKTRESPGKLTGKLSRVRKICKDWVRSRISRQGFREPVFPGRETGKKAGNLPGNPEFFPCILSGFQGILGFPTRETYQENPGFFPCILSGFQGDIRFSTGKPGTTPDLTSALGKNRISHRKAGKNGSYQGSLWTTLWPKQKDLFLKVPIWNNRKHPYENLTFKNQTEDVPNLRCTKAQRGGNRLTGVSTGQGGVVHLMRARGPHLRIIVLYKKTNI